MGSVEACIAAHRLGLGPRPGELARIARNPRAWAAGQIRSGLPVPEALTAFPTTRERIATIAGPDPDPDQTTGDRSQKIARSVAYPEIVAQYRERLSTDQPLVERMVSFWSNHFAVARNKGYNRALAPAYATEAIRPHVFGKFADLLFAAETHPVMGIYLDNVTSVGPNSPVGRRRNDLDINENLAREALELHTLGVDGGYSQDDVIQLALILTGWAYDRRNYRRITERLAARSDLNAIEEYGHSTFIPLLHEPGPKTLLGKTYPEAGAMEFRAVCDDLARHPATANFIATKLVRHFVNDDPPRDDVARIASVFENTQGDLAAVTRAVVDLDSVWMPTLAKMKTPDDFVVASWRAISFEDIELQALNAALAPMGQQPLMVPSPQGWPDTAATWAAPGGLMRRIEYAHQLARRIGNRITPADLLEWTIGPLASDETRKLVRGAPSGIDANAFIFASREFQRR